MTGHPVADRGFEARLSPPPMTTSKLDAFISDRRLLPATRAALLLRVCMIAQAVRPQLLERYWSELKAVANHLPASSRGSFEGLKGTLEPPAPASLGGFARKIVDDLAAAERGGNREATLAVLRDCEQRIKSRWWPVGKRPASLALVRLWIDVDRRDGLMHLHHARQEVQTNLLIRENDRSPLDPDDWRAVRKSCPPATQKAVAELLERDDPQLRLPAELADEAAEKLCQELFSGGWDDREAGNKRDKALARYMKLVDTVVKTAPEVAERLLGRWFRATAETAFYNERWVVRFFALFKIVRQWCSYPALEPRLAVYVSSSAPKHLRDAVLAYAAGLKPKTAEEADAAWAALEPTLSDRGPAEHWFLLTILRGGLREHALEMARRSTRAAQILPCLRRAWLYEEPDSARAIIRPEDVTGDAIDELLLRDKEGRVTFLRERTTSGQRPLPTVMWGPPNVLDIVAAITKSTDNAAVRGRAALGSWYPKTQPAESQFSVVVRIHGYGQHLYEDFDRILVATLVAWGDAHPDEIGRVTRTMWDAMRVEIKSNVRFDLIRNDIFERCQAVLCAHPPTVMEFVSWIGAELVKQPVQQQEGDTIYTFQLNERAPFLFALLGAQKVAKFSAQRCDEIIKQAISTYAASDELLTAAAQLYAADKGWSALEPPKLKQTSQLAAWQLGVLETSVRDILLALAGDVATDVGGAITGDAADAVTANVASDTSGVAADVAMPRGADDGRKGADDRPALAP